MKLLAAVVVALCLSVGGYTLAHEHGRAPVSKAPTTSSVAHGGARPVRGGSVTSSCFGNVCYFTGGSSGAIQKGP